MQKPYIYVLSRSNASRVIITERDSGESLSHNDNTDIEVPFAEKLFI